MALDISKINSLIGNLEQIAKTAVRISVPVIALLLIAEVVCGVNIGFIERVSRLLQMSYKEIIMYGFGGFVIYKALIK